jgi:hypothetical protein
MIGLRRLAAQAKFSDLFHPNEPFFRAPSRFWPSNPRKRNFQNNISYFVLNISFFGNFS